MSKKSQCIVVAFAHLEFLVGEVLLLQLPDRDALEASIERESIVKEND